MVLRLKPGTVAWGFPYRFRITGMHLADIIKFLVAASFGFMLHMLVGCPEQACPQCEDCAKVIAEQEILRADLHFQLREPFKPKNMYEVIRYEHFNMTSISSNFDDDPQINLLGHQKADIKDIIHQAMALYNSARPEKWKMVKLINGYRRLDPLRGEEYILDGVLALEKDEKVEESHRLELVKPFNVGHLLNDHSTSEKSVIHFILPISGHSEKFDTFIANFEEVCLKQPSENIYLLIVLFVGKDSVDDPDKLKTIARTLSDKYRNSHIRIIQTRSAFNRALGLDLGARQLPSDALLFFCDVDVQFNSNALHRCRHNAQEGHQVYYPVVFAQYSPDMVLKYSPPEKVKNLMAINKHTGHWIHYGFGMACMYNLDYHSVGGFNMQIKGWGGEDVDLYTKHVKSDLQVFRAMDPGLIHIYHDKTCAANLTADQTRMCVDSQAEGIGSKLQLAKHVIEMRLSRAAAPKDIDDNNINLYL